MAEYICEVVERPDEAPLMILARRERVTRCCDCVHCHVVPDGSTAFCDQLYDKPDWGLPAPYTGSEPAQMLEIGPNDFCSWGQTREVG